MTEQLVLDSPHNARTREVELDGKIRSIHFDRLAVGFIVDVLFAATEGGRGARSGQEVQIFGRRGRKIDEPTKPTSPTEAIAQEGSIHTLHSSPRSKDGILPGAAIRPRCTEEGDRRRELV